MVGEPHAAVFLIFEFFYFRYFFNNFLASAAYKQPLYSRPATLAVYLRGGLVTFLQCASVDL